MLKLPKLAFGLGASFGFGAAAFAWGSTNFSDLGGRSIGYQLRRSARTESTGPADDFTEEGVPEPLASALRAMLHDQATAIGFGRALVISLNRAAGSAHAYGHQPAVQMQLSAAREFAVAYADVLEHGSNFRSASATELEPLGDRDGAISTIDALRVRSSIIRRRLAQTHS